MQPNQQKSPSMFGVALSHIGQRKSPAIDPIHAIRSNAMSTVTSASSPGVRLAAVKARQQAAWSAGNYAVVGTTLQIVGEILCEALDLRAGSSVLDVAAGNGNATLAAARRGCDVTSTDYVPSLLERGKARAAADGFAVRFKEA